MKLRLLQLGLTLVLAACGRSPEAVARAAGLPFAITPIAAFNDPWALAFLPSSGLRIANTALVTEKRGRIWLVDVVSGRKQQVGGVPAVVTSGTDGQGGLLDIALSPTFAADRLVYLTYSQPSANGGSELALARARLGDGPSLQNLAVIWHDPEGGTGGQFGGVIAFAADGKSLFLSSGDRQRFTPAQDPSEPLGKILHLTLAGGPAAGNPWFGRTGAQTVTVTDPPEDTAQARRATGRQVRWPGPNLTPSETWSIGHRNPYGLAFAPDGRLWETEMGPRGGDEINLIERGSNYGWPLVSEGKNYDRVPIPPHSTRPDVVPPKLYWVPSVSPSSLMFYSGKLFPRWKGSAFIGALSGQALVRATIAGDGAAKADLWDMGARIRWVGEGPEGAIYLLEDGAGGRLLRLTPPTQTRR
jgi:glucose/arabinose dehydrogenase